MVLIEMVKKSSILMLILTAMMFALSIPAMARTVYVSRVGNGVYGVYDPTTGKSVYVRDLQAYLKSIATSNRVDGFGGSISQKEFAKGAEPVKEATDAAANVVNSAANSAYNAANMVPSWRKYTAPVRALLDD